MSLLPPESLQPLRKPRELNGNESAFRYGDANTTGATSWTAYIDYVKVWKPGAGMNGQ